MCTWCACVQHILLHHSKLLQAFRLFFQIKMVNHCGVHVIFQDIEHQLQENILHDFLHYNFL